MALGAVLGGAIASKAGKTAASNIVSTATQPSTWLGLSQALRARKLKKQIQGMGGTDKQAFESFGLQANLANVGQDRINEVYDVQENLANMIGSQGIPEESKQYEQDLIEQGGQQAMRTAGSVGELSEMLGQIQGGQLSAYRNLAARDAEQRQQNLNTKASMLSAAKEQQLAALQSQDAAKAQAMMDLRENLLAPRIQEQQALTGAAIQNMMEGYRSGQTKQAQGRNMFDLTSMFSGGNGRRTNNFNPPTF